MRELNVPFLLFSTSEGLKDYTEKRLLFYVISVSFVCTILYATSHTHGYVLLFNSTIRSPRNNTNKD